jgi:hypothetical protein
MPENSPFPVNIVLPVGFKKYFTAGQDFNIFLTAAFRKRKPCWQAANRASKKSRLSAASSIWNVSTGRLRKTAALLRPITAGVIPRMRCNEAEQNMEFRSPRLTAASAVLSNKKRKTNSKKIKV